MALTTAASAGPSAYWYLTRSSGVVALLLMTGAVVLGVLDVRRVSSPQWPRFVLDTLHRNVSLLAVVFLGVHVITSVLDSFASIPLLDAFVPFVGSYRPFWLGLGALSFDLLLAVIVTSLLRRRVGYRSWRAVHALTYLSWPIALLHGLGTGTDVSSAWLLALCAVCVVAVLAAALARAIAALNEHPDRAWAGIGGIAIFAVFLAVWLPGGPLGAEWSRRAGTPAALLTHKHATHSTAGNR
jgi:methionine sulfoxide reductase heme-binding subunit